MSIITFMPRDGFDFGAIGAPDGAFKEFDYNEEVIK